ncbi:MAG: Omp28 family outer membrane lipoprotein [bacterium]|nr:Omp28 family outer membrane lipoprotein [bacterium]
MNRYKNFDLWKLTSSAFIAGMMLITVSCDVVEAPYEETPDIPDTTVAVPQNILLEDFTGHYCGNCPEGTKVVRQLEAAYGERLIVIAMHVGNLALPSPPDFPMDFRCKEGNDIDKTFKVALSGIPKGFINRFNNGLGLLLDKGEWPTIVASEMTRKAAVDLKVNRTYDSTTKTVTLDVTVKYLDSGTVDDNLVAMLTESNIISDQLDYKANPQHIEDYEFDYMLRASFNGAWGEPLSSTSIPAGTTITKQLTYTLPAGKTWVPENCDVVVYVHRHNTTKQVLQVKKVSLTGL